jgi:hypothetical protein
VDINLTFDNKTTENKNQTKFLGIILDSTLKWSEHIESITPQLNAACYALRKLKHIVSQQTLLMVYYSYFHSIMSYGTIFGGTSQYSINIFKIQKRMIRIITNSGSRKSCRPLFNKLQILTFYEQYIFSVLCFVCKNKELYRRNVEIHGKNTRNNLDFYVITTNLTTYQKHIYYMGQKIFNTLPSHIKDKIDNGRAFKRLIRNFLYCNNFYSLEEYFNYETNKK